MTETEVATDLRANPGTTWVVNMRPLGGILGWRVLADVRASLYREYARLHYWFPKHGGFSVSVNSAALTITVSYVGI